MFFENMYILYVHPLQIRADGTVEVTFYGTHNHCVQQEYAAHFLNPIKHVRSIREFLDAKLFAGVRKMASIKNDLVQDTLGDRHCLKKFEDFRRFQMGLYLKRTHVMNRRDQLGLNVDKLRDRYALIMYRLMLNVYG